MLRHAVEGLPSPQRAVAHGLPQHERVNASFDPHGKRLGERGLDNIAGAIMHQLGDGASTDWTNVVRFVSNSIEHMFILVINRSVATDPDRQSSATSPVWPATHWGVQHVRPRFGEHVMDVAHQRRRVGTQIEVNLTWAYPMQQAILTEGDRLHLWGTRQ